MTQVIAITNQKGGVGKTTTAINLSSSLAYRGSRVLLIDLDPQGNTTSGCGIDKKILDKTIYHSLLDDEGLHVYPLDKIKLNIVPADGNLIAAEVELSKLAGGENKLKSLIEKVQSQYDFVLIDCPPALGLLTANALVAADGLIIPMQCEYFAMEGLSSLLDTVSYIQESLNPKIKIIGLLRTLFDSRNTLSWQVSEQLDQHFSNNLFTVKIPRNISLAEAPSHGLPIILYDKNSKGAHAYLALADELLAKQ